MAARPSRRRLLLGAALLGATISPLLAACAQPAPATPTPAQPTPAPKAEPTPASKPAAAAGKVQVISWQDVTNAIEFAVVEHNKRQNKVEVVVEMPGAATTQKLNAALAAGSGGPDMFWPQPSSMPLFIKQQAFAEITEEVKPHRKDFAEFKLLEGTDPFSGKQYSVPWQVGVVGLWYREDLLAGVGMKDIPGDFSYDDYVVLGKKLKEKGIFLDSMAFAGDINRYSVMLWQRGGAFTSRDWKTVTLDDDKSVQTLKVIKKLFDEGLYMDLVSNSPAYWAAMKEGKFATILRASWHVNAFRTQITRPEDGGGLWRAAPMPVFEKGGASTANHGGSHLSILAQSKYKDQCWDFLTYACTTVEGVLHSVKKGIVTPFLPALQHNDFLNTTHPPTGSFLPNKLWAELLPKVSNTFYFSPVVDEASTILVQEMPKLLRNDMTVESWLKFVADKVREANKQYLT